jgi:hypothetical protein
MTVFHACMCVSETFLKVHRVGNITEGETYLLNEISDIAVYGILNIMHKL